MDQAVMKLLQAVPNATDCFMTVGIVFLSAFIIIIAYFYIDVVLLFCYNITKIISVSWTIDSCVFF